MLKRAYDKASPKDGYRVLVDRLWPRGISRTELKMDAWEKDIAPSPELRRWFNHDPKRWDEFRRRYKAELRSSKDRLSALKKASRQITLIYGAKDQEHNHALVLKEVLDTWSL